jgi:hypothetical protein
VGDFEQVLARLRGIALPCVPPMGIGEFHILYASEREVVVWYSPAREGHRPGEVAIPTTRLASAWRALTAGTVLDEQMLVSLGGGQALGRWLLAVLALLPGSRVELQPLQLTWSKRRRSRGTTIAPESHTASAPVPLPRR